MPTTAFDDDEKRRRGTVAGGAVGAPGEGSAVQQAATAPPQESNGAGQSYTQLLNGGDSEATQTGFLNFDRFFNANADVANREARRVNEGVANQAQKAKKGVQGVNQSYLDALNGGGPGTGPGFDEAGNWQGGAAGPVGMSPGGAASAGRAGLESQARTASQAAQLGIPSWTDMPGYQQSLDDVLEAQRQLDALGSEAGLAELSGGTSADAALLGTAGRGAFRQTQDAYGKKGTGHESLLDYANAVADEAEDEGAVRQRERAARADEYRRALEGYDAANGPGASDASGASEPTGDDRPAIGGGGTIGDLKRRAAEYASKSTAGTQLGNRILEAFSALSAENWQNIGHYRQGELAEQIGESYGLDKAASDAAFKDFIGSLDPSLAAWVLGLVGGSGSNTGKSVLNGYFPGLGDEVHKLTGGANSSPEEWATFQQLFHEYLRSRRESDERAAQEQHQEQSQRGHGTAAQEAAAASAAAASKTGRH